MNLAEFAGAVRGVAARCDESLAVEAARRSAREALAILQMETPVRSGALRASERVWRVFGSGAEAEAVYGPNIIYDHFRNDGGTITVRRAKVLTDGSSFFGRSVTQAGDHYMERGTEMARGPAEEICRIVADEMIRL